MLPLIRTRECYAHRLNFPNVLLNHDLGELGDAPLSIDEINAVNQIVNCYRRKKMTRTQILRMHSLIFARVGHSTPRAQAELQLLHAYAHGPLQSYDMPNLFVVPNQKRYQDRSRDPIKRTLFDGAPIRFKKNSHGLRQWSIHLGHPFIGRAPITHPPIGKTHLFVEEHYFDTLPADYRHFFQAWQRKSLGVVDVFNCKHEPKEIPISGVERTYWAFNSDVLTKTPITDPLVIDQIERILASTPTPDSGTPRLPSIK